MNLNNEILNKYKDIYIYGFGLSGKWISDNLTIKPKGFVDTDEKKKNQLHSGIRVYTVDELKKKISKKDLIIVTVVDIQDVIPILNRDFPNNKWLAIGEYLSSTKVDGSINITGEDDSFINYSLKAVELCQKAYIRKDSLFLRSVDVVISEKCSLKCKDCSNLMQYYQSPNNFSKKDVIENFEKLTSKISFIFEVRLIGGEPFMNKEIYDIIDYFCENKKIEKLVIYTNGTIPLKKDRIKNYADNLKLVFTVTDYGKLSKNTDKVCNDLSEMNVPMRRHPPENWTDSGKIFDFKRTKQEMIELFDACCGKNLLTSMYGKLYRCPFAANADSLKAIPENDKNYVKVDATPKEILNYTREIKYIPACNFCKGRSFDAEEIKPAIQTDKPLIYQTLK